MCIYFVLIENRYYLLVCSASRWFRTTAIAMKLDYKVGKIEHLPSALDSSSLLHRDWATKTPPSLRKVWSITPEHITTIGTTIKYGDGCNHTSPLYQYKTISLYGQIIKLVLDWYIHRNENTNWKYIKVSTVFENHRKSLI